jgi:large subunit ribosomal protein L23
MAAFWNKFKKEKKKVDEKTSGDSKSSSSKAEDKQEPLSSQSDEKAEKNDNKTVTKDLKEEVVKVEEDKNESDKKKKKKKKKKSKVKFANFKEKAELVNNIIISPVVSEDAMNKEAQSKYVFKVSESSNKSEIKEALEARFKITVEKVNIIKYKTRAHKFRYRKGQKKGFKKAIVTVKKGEKIELFK